ncbi:hypothetical protein [Mucilaginibacter terrigena]|uniref:hypothetical protein n=1 Tax=Mucilaginibacter terrigena TaxID=2492395 RepID=UPI001396B872|nr:hypothetical protein [Mucilaginibacter terrigena]
MKKIIIAAALVLTSAVTAFSLTTSNTTKADTKLNQDALTTSVKNTAAPKSDIATAD